MSFPSAPPRPRLLPLCLALATAVAACTRPNAGYSEGRPADAAAEVGATPEVRPPVPNDADLPDLSIADGPGADASPPDSLPLDLAPDAGPPDLPGDLPPDLSPDLPRDLLPDLPPDAAPGGRSVTVTGSTLGPAWGGTGGMRWQDECPAGEALIGYRGYLRNYLGDPATYVTALQAVCGRFRVPPGGTAVELVSTTPLPLRGNTSPMAWEALCPAGSIVFAVAARVSPGDSVEHLQVRCAPHTAAAGATSLSRGFTGGGGLPYSGTGTVSSEDLFTCPLGQVARGHVLRVGSWLDGFQLICGTAAVSP